MSDSKTTARVLDGTALAKYVQKAAQWPPSLPARRRGAIADTNDVQDVLNDHRQHQKVRIAAASRPMPGTYANPGRSASARRLASS